MIGPVFFGLVCLVLLGLFAVSLRDLPQIGRLVRRSVVSNLGRLSLTLIAVVLGVSFVSGSFVLADSLRSVFSGIVETSFAGVDAQVRGVESDVQSNEFIAPRFDGDIVAGLSALDEVEYAEGSITGFENIFLLDADGEIIRPTGPPVIASSWGGPSPTSPIELIEGTVPEGQQVAIDEIQLDRLEKVVGDTVMVAGPLGDPAEYTISGIVEFPGGAGAYFNVFDLPTAQALLDAEGQIDAISINKNDDVNIDDVLAAVGQELPAGVEVVSGEVVIEESQADFSEFIDIFGNILLGFAVVVLFVSTFIIYNTFSILVGQRTKQLGLLRSLGAGAHQIRSMVLIEAFIVGLIASGIGLLGGIGVASILKALFSAGGAAFPDGPLEIRARTIYVVVFVGLVVTVFSALMPAVRASRVTPLEAIRDERDTAHSLKRRLTIGAAVLVPGLILLGFGMFGDAGSTTNTLSALGVGAALTFIGVSLVSALFAGPVTAAIGSPIEGFKGTVGRLAKDNASRNPQRTTATATALMIGLALITGVAVLTTSLLATFDKLLEDSLTADYFVFEESQQLPFAASIVDELGNIAAVEQVAGNVRVEVRLDDEPNTVIGFDTSTGTSVVNYGVVEGESVLSGQGLSVYAERAETDGLSIGDTLTFTFEDGADEVVVVESIFDDQSIVDADFVVDRSLIQGHMPFDSVNFVGINLVDGANIDEAQAEINAIAANYPQVAVQSNAEFQEEISGQVTQLQVVIYGLLVLCLIVAFFGIVNTMAMSVLERTREIGLLRAVGTTRRQLRSAIRWEAIIVSFFGSVLGVLMGVLLGWAAVLAIPDTFVSEVGIPWAQIVAFLIVGVVIGVIAALFPAHRAAKMDVLAAISTE